MSDLVHLTKHCWSESENGEYPKDLMKSCDPVWLLCHPLVLWHVGCQIWTPCPIGETLHSLELWFCMWGKMHWKDRQGFVCFTDVLPSQYAFERVLKSVLKRHRGPSVAVAWNGCGEHWRLDLVGECSNETAILNPPGINIWCEQHLILQGYQSPFLCGVEWRSCDSLCNHTAW